MKRWTRWSRLSSAPASSSERSPKVMRELYTQVIMDHYQRPRNKGELEDADLEEHLLNPLCGDEVTVYALFDGDRVADVKFGGRGCSISQASASRLTEGGIELELGKLVVGSHCAADAPRAALNANETGNPRRPEPRDSTRERKDDEPKTIGEGDPCWVDNPRRQLGADGVARSEHGPPCGVVGRADARRGRVGARLAGAANGAAVGTAGVAGGRRRRARRGLPTLGPPLDSPPLAPRVPRGLRHLVLEPGGRIPARPGC